MAMNQTNLVVNGTGSFLSNSTIPIVSNGASIHAVTLDGSAGNNSNAGDPWIPENNSFGTSLLWVYFILVLVYLSGLNLILDAKESALWSQRLLLGNAVLLGTIFCSDGTYGAPLGYEGVILGAAFTASINVLSTNVGSQHDSYVKLALNMQFGALLASLAWATHAATYRLLLYRLDWHNFEEQRGNMCSVGHMSTSLGQPAWRTRAGSCLICVTWVLTTISTTAALHSNQATKGYDHPRLVTIYLYFTPIALASVVSQFCLTSEEGGPDSVKGCFELANIGFYKRAWYEEAVAQYLMGCNLVKWRRMPQPTSTIQQVIIVLVAFVLYLGDYFLKCFSLALTPVHFIVVVLPHMWIMYAVGLFCMFIVTFLAMLLFGSIALLDPLPLVTGFSKASIHVLLRLLWIFAPSAGILLIFRSSTKPQVKIEQLKNKALSFCQIESISDEDRLRSSIDLRVLLSNFSFLEIQVLAPFLLDLTLSLDNVDNLEVLIRDKFQIAVL